MRQVTMLSDASMALVEDYLTKVAGISLGSETRFEIQFFKIRQELARRIYKKYGFESYAITFDKPSPEFKVKYLQESLNDQTCVINVSAESEAENMLGYEMGFSLVIKELIKHKKPLVGHNMFLDLLFIYN